MKYKAGDKVRIKTWKAMRKEFGLDRDNEYINCSCHFIQDMEEQLPKDRIAIIKSIKNEHYTMKELDWSWSDDMIERLAPKPSPIESRFEILDIR